MNEKDHRAGHVYAYDPRKQRWESLCGGHIERDFPAPDEPPHRECLERLAQIQATPQDRWPALAYKRPE